METLQWIYKLRDDVSGPAGRIRGSLDGILDAVKGIPASAAVAQQGLSMLLGAARQLASVVFDGGKFALNALAFKESTLASFESMTGSAQAARDLFNTAKSFGRLTPFETKDVVDSFRQLRGAGFSDKQTEIIFQGLGDVAALSGNDQAISAIAQQFAQVRGLGKLQFADLKVITQWTGLAGTSIDKIYDQIAKLKGVSTEAAKALVSGGNVSADEGLFAIMSALKESAGGELGSSILKQATTLKGLFSTLSSFSFDEFLEIDLDKSAGFKGIKQFAQNLADVMNPATESGVRLRKVFEGVIDSVGTWLGSFSAASISDGFGRLVDIVELGITGFYDLKDSVMDVLQPTLDFIAMMDDGKSQGLGFREVMSGIGYVLGFIANGALMIGFALKTAFDGFMMLGDIDWSYLWEQISSAGADLLKGLAEGILGAISWPVNAILSAGQATITAFKTLLGIHSPSRVFEQLGEFTAEGFARGVDNGDGGVASAINKMVPVPSPSRGGGGRNISLTLNLTVNSQRDDGEAIARKLADLLPSQLTSMFEQLALEDGVA